MSFIAGTRVISATGGTISTITGYTVHRFSTVGVSTFIPRGTGTIEVLVVGAGGLNYPGAGGGGGGGNVVYNKFVNVTSGTSYPITIGAVGPLSSVGGATSCSFNNINTIAYGGGAGGAAPATAGVSSTRASGGGGGNSGGGGSGGIGAGVTGLGFPGAPGTLTLSGGGGGSGASGTSVNGGIGVSYSITGVSSYYGGGGGGYPAGFPNGGPATAPLASFGTGGTPGAVIIRYPS